jgi:hypothetical protein
MVCCSLVVIAADAADFLNHNEQLPPAHPDSDLKANNSVVRNPSQRGKEQRQTLIMPQSSASIRRSVGTSIIAEHSAKTQKEPTATSFTIPTTSTLPVQPDRSVGAAPTIISRWKPFPSAKNTAALNGTEMRRKH